MNAMKALRQAVLGKFESAVLEYLFPPSSDLLEKETANLPTELTDETVDAPEDRDILPVLDVLEREVTPRQGQVLGEMRRQYVEEGRQQFSPKLAGRQLRMPQTTVRSHLRDIRARADRARSKNPKNRL